MVQYPRPLRVLALVARGRGLKITPVYASGESGVPHSLQACLVLKTFSNVSSVKRCVKPPSQNHCKTFSLHDVRIFSYTRCRGLNKKRLFGTEARSAGTKIANCRPGPSVAPASAGGVPLPGVYAGSIFLSIHWEYIAVYTGSILLSIYWEYIAVYIGAPEWSPSQ